MRKERVVRAVDGTELFIEEYGEGRSLLLCDGLLCDGHIWKYFVPALESTHHLVHWHYPGHGRSAEPSRFAEMSPSRLADDAALLWRDLCRSPKKKFTVVGHSLGVQVALETWRRHSELVEGLILICGSPGNLIQDFHEGPLLGYVVPILDAIGRFTPQLVSSLWQKLPAHLLTKAAMMTREVDPRLLRSQDLVAYFEGLRRVDFRLALRLLESAGRHDAVSYLAEIDVPTLVIAGQKDTFTPPYRSELMGRLIRNCEFHLVKGGTHSLPLEQNDLINLLVQKFLAARID